MLLIIRKEDGLIIEEADQFFDDDYLFGSGRVRTIIQMSGLGYRKFGWKYQIPYSTLVSWITERTGNGPHNPCPSMRFKLAMIQAELRREKAKQEAVEKAA